eukprot:540130-Rhodomonas_salina.2
MLAGSETGIPTRTSPRTISFSHPHRLCDDLYESDGHFVTSRPQAHRDRFCDVGQESPPANENLISLILSAPVRVPGYQGVPSFRVSGYQEGPGHVSEYRRVCQCVRPSVSLVVVPVDLRLPVLVAVLPGSRV